MMNCYAWVSQQERADYYYNLFNEQLRKNEKLQEENDRLRAEIERLGKIESISGREIEQIISFLNENVKRMERLADMCRVQKSTGKDDGYCETVMCAALRVLQSISDFAKEYKVVKKEGEVILYSFESAQGIEEELCERIDSYIKRFHIQNRLGLCSFAGRIRREIVDIAARWREAYE